MRGARASYQVETLDSLTVSRTGSTRLVALPCSTDEMIASISASAACRGS